MENLTSYDGTFSERLAQAIKLHDEGVGGSAASAKEANRLIKKLRDDYPTTPLVDAYYGSTMILIARDKSKPLEQLKWANKGLRILDRAVTEAPEDNVIRLLRGKSAYHLPEKYFRRTQTAIEDFTTVIKQNADQKNILEPGEYTQLIDELGEAYYRIGRNEDAANLWKMLEIQTTDSNLKQQYAYKLQLLEGKPAIEEITYEDPTSMLIGTTRAVGAALIEWSAPKKSKKKKKSNDKKRRK